MIHFPIPMKVISRPIVPIENSPVIAQRKMKSPIPVKMFLMPCVRGSFGLSSLEEIFRKRLSGSKSLFDKAIAGFPVLVAEEENDE